MRIAFEHQVTDLLFNSTAKIITCLILQRTSTNDTKPKVAESENIGANHLGFAKSLFQHYCQHLGLNHNHISVESAFNFYVNKKIFSLLGTPVNIESARETFYRELIQNTNLPTNHNFTSIITEINKEIEHHTQQKYPITYASKGKGKLQTPAITPRKIQPPTWKKNRIESPSNLSYHYTPGSAIHISSTDAFPSTATPAFGQFPFQSRQRKTELLGPYGKYFEGFNSQSSISSELQSPPSLPNFEISDPWEAAESRKKEKELEDQKFTYQHLITENPKVETPNFQTQQNPDLENSEIKTLNHQRQNNPNPKLINQQNLPLVNIIDQSPINPIAEPIQQPLQLPSQQPEQQQLLQQPPQPPNLDPMTYAPIAKLDNFTGEEDDAQVWLNDVEKAIAANGWNNAQAIQAIPYFFKDTADFWYQSLVNKPQDFNVFKAEFLKYFSNNNSINRLVNIFTTMKQGETEAILNQFICGLHSSILQHVHPLHSGILQDAVTHARDFESAESEANHAQAVNLVMNGPSELDSKLEKFSESINKRLEEYLADNHAIYQSPQRCNNQGNFNRVQNQLHLSSSTNQQWQQETCICHYCVPNSKSVPKSKPTCLLTSDAVINLSVSGVSSSNLSTTATSGLSTTAATNNLSTPTNSNTAPKLTTQQNPKTKNNSTELEIGDSIFHSNHRDYASRIQNYLSFLVTPEDASTNKPTFAQNQPLTSNIPSATITEDESLAAIFPFEFEETAAMPLFSEATLEAKPITAMYTDAKVERQSIKLILDSIDRAASGRIITADGATKTPISEINDFPFEVNGIMTSIKVLVMEATQYQALVGQHICVLAMCGHFKTPPREKLLIKLEEEKKKPTWEAYQVSWANEQGKEHTDHYELLPILSWDNNPKGKQRKELTWETNDLIWTNNKQKEISSWEWNEDKRKGKEKKERMPPTTTIYNSYTHHTPQQFNYRWPRLRQGKWDNQPCLACGETLLDERMWNDIPECGRTMTITKIEGATSEKIREIKNNPPEFIELDWDAESVLNSLEPEEFHEHYQNLALTREEQEQWLAQLNTRLCHHCLILSNFEYCDNCDLIYNPPPYMIYSIPEEEEPISSCTSESESLINCDPDFDDNNENIGSSSIQNGKDNKNDSNSGSNSDLNYKQYIALPDLFKKQELKWYSDNGEGIMPEHMHDTDAGFDLRYSGKDAIKLEPHSCTCIDLKITLEIPATTMSSLVKREINIRGGIIDAGYVRNIIAMLQNDSEKAYIIEPNKKIAQTIFLPLVRIAQLVSMEKREELGITAREIQGFGSMNRIDVLVNMAEEEIVGQGEIISTGQAISIPPYNQYMLAIERKEKDQAQIFETEASLCELGEVGLINLHIPAKDHSHIKIPIYNNTGNAIVIPARTIIEYLSTEIEDQPPNSIPDFPQLCEYVDIISQTIYG
ncbi:hypothetical protein G9A89_020291 [Geosiphon pyriformis]|nr:hypothetical protein G9A89_020291 [Geosiphon pyriformis]